jgi:hypothetical protein
LFAWCGIDMVVVSFLEAWGDWWEGWRCGASSCWGIEAFLAELGSCAGDLDRRCSKREWLRLYNLADLGVLYLVALACLGGRMRVDVHGVTWRRAPAAGARRQRTESRSVGCGLRAQLSKVEVRSGAITLSHGLPELALGPESVEDNAVDDDAEELDNDLDNAADKCPVLEIR